jgi:hypothetical protein
MLVAPGGCGGPPGGPGGPPKNEPGTVDIPDEEEEEEEDEGEEEAFDLDYNRLSLRCQHEK